MSSLLFKIVPSKLWLSNLPLFFGGTKQEIQTGRIRLFPPSQLPVHYHDVKQTYPRNLMLIAFKPEQLEFLAPRPIKEGPLLTLSPLIVEGPLRVSPFNFHSSCEIHELPDGEFLFCRKYEEFIL